jgi:NAD-dependent SIR2 family protein deacetylase
MNPTDELCQALLRTRGLVLVVTGAGISLASGIPTFRGKDPGAVWGKDVTELGTARYFHEEPEGSWLWYLSRFEKVLSAQPNPAHFALVALERWQLDRGGRFLLVTQNLDPLHERAGSRELIKVHGSADRVRCSREGCRLGAPNGSIPRSQVDLAGFLSAPVRERVPRCPECQSLLRQHVLWFDELYSGHQDYQWERVLEGAATAELIIFVGTSLSVGVTERVLDSAHARHAPVFLIDPSARSIRGVIAIAAAAEVALVSVSRAVGAARA